jgi:hypothetical protein
MPEDIYNIDFSDVEKSVEQDDRIALRVPGFCIVVMDRHIFGEGWIHQFEDTPLGYNQAMRWAVRLDEQDIDNPKSPEQIRAEYETELGFSEQE